MNKLVKTVIKDDLIKEFLTALNGILQLTSRELELLITLVQLDSKKDKHAEDSKNITNKENRKYIRKTLGITPDNLSRYFAKFKKEGILIDGKGDEEVYINKALIPEIIGDRVQITVILKLKKDETN